MKLYLPLIAAALALAACGGENAPSAPASEAHHDHAASAASAASQAVPASEAASAPAAAAEGCSKLVETGDSMQYNTAAISVPKSSVAAKNPPLLSPWPNWLPAPTTNSSVLSPAMPA